MLKISLFYLIFYLYIFMTNILFSLDQKIIEFIFPPVHAAEIATGPFTFAKNVTLKQLFTTGTSFFFGGVAFYALFKLVMGGVSYMQAGGDSKKAGEAQEQIKNALIGIGVCIAAVSLITIVSSVIGGGGGVNPLSGDFVEKY